MNSFDLVADRFEGYRMLPGHVPAAVRQALHMFAGVDSKARLLEVGCGTGRIGAQFSTEGDNYLGVDVSTKMLRKFSGKGFACRPNLVQADGCLLPFGDHIFASVLMMHVVVVGNWRALLTEALRVLKKRGVLVTGNIRPPVNGIDERMQNRLAELIVDMGIAEPSHDRGAMSEWLRARSSCHLQITPARWTIDRTPREFLLRKRTAARFASLPAQVQEAALRSLEDWTEQNIGPLDAPFTEAHYLSLELHWF